MIKVVVFDAYGTLFDVYSIGALADSLYPGHGAAIATLWRDKQVEYTRFGLGGVERRPCRLAAKGSLGGWHPAVQDLTPKLCLGARRIPGPGR